MKVVEAKINGNMLEVKIGASWLSTTLNANEEDLKEIGSSKERVKQALKLKEAGFTGKEIIDIIGELDV